MQIWSTHQVYPEDNLKKENDLKNEEDLKKMICPPSLKRILPDFFFDDLSP